MQRMAAHFGGDICLAFDRPIDGVETAVAPAACIAATTAFPSAAYLEQTFTPPDFPSPLAPSSPPRPSRSFQDAFNHAMPDAGAHRASRAAIG